MLDCVPFVGGAAGVAGSRQQRSSPKWFSPCWVVYLLVPLRTSSTMWYLRRQSCLRSRVARDRYLLHVRGLPLLKGWAFLSWPVRGHPHMFPSTFENTERNYQGQARQAVCNPTILLAFDPGVGNTGRLHFYGQARSLCARQNRGHPRTQRGLHVWFPSLALHWFDVVPQGCRLVKPIHVFWKCWRAW